MNGLSDLVVRSYRDGDEAALGVIFHRAVHEGAASLYSEDERRAWSPSAPDTAKWRERLSEVETVVAETPGRPVGFMSLDLSRGYLDLAFVLPEVMGRGVARSLYAVIESRARAAGLAELTTEASLVAEPFFAAQGFRVLKRQQIERLGVMLTNAVMMKALSKAGEAA